MISKNKLHTQVYASMSNTIRVVSCLGMARRVVWLEPDHTQWRTRWWRVTALLGVGEVPTISIYLYKYIYPYMYIYIHILIYIYVYVHVYINIYKQMYIHIYMYNCIDIHTCMVASQLYMYICIHVVGILSFPCLCPILHVEKVMWFNPHSMSVGHIVKTRYTEHLLSYPPYGAREWTWGPELWASGWRKNLPSEGGHNIPALASRPLWQASGWLLSYT